MEELLNDKANDAYGLIYATSIAISPLIGSNLYQRFGARETCDKIALFDFTWATILLVFNCGFDVF